MKTILNTLVTILLVCSGCASVNRMIDQGDFDHALGKSIRKITGNHQLKKKYVLAIEEGFAKATAQDLSNIEKLQVAENAANWKRIIRIIEGIDKRQNTVSRFVPLVSKDGYRATFEFVEIPGRLKEATDKFVHFRYAESSELVKLGRRGDKEAAQIAYSLLDEIWDFRSTYRDAHALQSEALELGINHIFVAIDNGTGAHIPDELSDEILYQNFIDDQWTKYHFAANIPSDRKIKILLTQLQISPERIGETNYIESKKINDGFRYVLDEDGNVAKDSLGNDIKERNYKTVRARVTEIQQSKSALIMGKITIQDPINASVKAIPFDSEVVFEHLSLTFSGDPRALSSESKELLENAVMPFPATNALVHDLMRSLHSVIKSKISRNVLEV